MNWTEKEKEMLKIAASGLHANFCGCNERKIREAFEGVENAQDPVEIQMYRLAGVFALASMGLSYLRETGECTYEPMMILEEARQEWHRQVPRETRDRLRGILRAAMTREPQAEA